MDYRAAATWMARPTGGRVYALILGRHSGIYPPRFRHLKNVPLTIDDAEDVRELRPYLLRYRPEGVYYDRNVYAPLEATRRANWTMPMLGGAASFAVRSWHSIWIRRTSTVRSMATSPRKWQGTKASRSVTGSSRRFEDKRRASMTN